MMTPAEFARLRQQGYTRIPLVREVLADLETPLSCYLKLALNQPYTYLLESVQGGERWGRYSIIGLPSRSHIRVRGQHIEWVQDGATQTLEVADPLAWIERYQAGFKVPTLAGLPRFTGGLVGYFGYDTVRLIEPRLAGLEKPDPLNTPDILLLISEEVVVFDNLAGSLYLITHVDPDMPHALEEGQARLGMLEASLREPAVYPPLHGHLDSQAAELVSGFTEVGFKQAVEQVRTYIHDGDVMQVVLSQRMTAPFHARPLDLYRALRRLNPSPYLFYFDLGDFHVVGSSPEILVRLEEGEITVRPIAGTRARGATRAEDEALEQELLADPKELAEHLMLIDLGRNDVGRVARTGSVRVTERMLIERYSHVMHIVSNVSGALLPGRGAFDVLRATFPAGTLSGAPKVRAMEIIDELEPVKRGIYGGAVGYMAWGGNMDTAIAIRTAVIKDRQLHIQAGAGIVYDSVPDHEWIETLNKARAIARAAAWAEAGLIDADFGWVS